MSGYAGPMKRILACSALALTVAPALVQAQAAPPAGYLAPGAIDPAAILPEPPTPGSPAEVADRAGYAEAARLVGTPRWAQAAADDDMSVAAGFRHFRCALNAELTPERAPALNRLFTRTRLDVGTFAEGIKARYGRKRPFAEDAPDAPLCIAIPPERRATTSLTYPSGSATLGWLWGLALAQAAPERASQTVARGRELGDSRLVCRVHYQTDVDAGRLLASAMFARVQTEAAFRADVEAARAEIAAATAPTPLPGCGT